MGGLGDPEFAIKEAFMVVGCNLQKKIGYRLQFIKANLDINQNETNEAYTGMRELIFNYNQSICPRDYFFIFMISKDKSANREVKKALMFLISNYIKYTVRDSSNKI